jgi:hypothetical protein
MMFLPWRHRRCLKADPLLQRHARLDHVYTKGLVSESMVMPDATTDHRPVVTTVRAGGHCPGTKLDLSQISSILL